MVIIIRLYDKSETDFSHNGKRILKPTEAVITEELNGDYSLKITMPRGEELIEIEEIIKAETPKTMQLFRVFETDVDILGNPVYYARHIFYDLLDYFIEDTRPTVSGAHAISEILKNTPFTGNSDITTQKTAYYQMISPVKAILGADNAFTKIWGGELERDNFNVFMRSKTGADRGVIIRYKKNLSGLRLKTDLSGTFTKIMPTGLKENGQTLLYLPERYVESPLIGNYTHIKTTRIHYSNIKISEEMTEQEAINALKNAANLEFENGLDKPIVTANVEFIPLQNTEEYKNFAVLESVYLGDTVKIFHEPMNINLSARVVGYEYDCLSSKYTKITIGNVSPKFGDTQKQYTQNQKDETITFLSQAITNATQLITGNKGGYIVLNPTEKPQEILIMDTPNMQTAQKVWRWNLSGLGYSSTGVNGEYSLAITQDGAIVADFIRAYTLNGALLQAGTVEAGSISQDYKQSVTDEMKDKTDEVTQAFQVADGALLSQISQSYTNKTEFESYQETVSTKFTQTANDWTFQFTNLTQEFNSFSSDTQENFNEIVRYIRFVDGNIILGMINNSSSLKISNGRISFMEGETEVAYISNGKLFITDGEFLNSLQLGNFTFEPRSNGNLSFYKNKK